MIASQFVINDLENDLLGRGGMGEVYRATDTQTGETVAVKALNPDIVTRNPDLLERFQREGEALRQLNHPNIVRFITAIQEHGCHYLVMEYISGGSLEDLLAKQGHLDPEKTVEIALDLADALTRAHRLGILHRDLKPANVLLAEDGTPRLADFGIAYQQSGERLTQTGVLVGTVDYLSPEVCQGEPPDERSDIWSFGVLLFQMLAGRLPFEGQNLTAKITAILTQPVPDITALSPSVPDALADLVYRMLEKDPQQRIPSVRLVGAELEATLKGRTPAQPESRFSTPTPSAKGIPHNMPTQSTPFVGREVELDQLDRLLSDPAIRMLTIVGLGGMGKTRLAIEAGRRQLQRFPQGVYFVPLAALKSIETIDPTIAQALGVNFPGEGVLHQQLLNYLREKRILIILDNFEHVRDGMELVIDFMRVTNNVKLLITSRMRLNIQDETIFQLTGMDFPDRETPEDAMEYSAVKLFLQRAQRVRPGYQLDREDLRNVARICRLVGGMPLGILLAASWLEILSSQEIVDEIARNLDFLQSGLVDLPERQRNLRSIFDYSWNLLNPHEQEVISGLSVFRGGFTREAAQSVTGASLLDMLVLTNKALLQRDPAGRYAIHELLRQYTEEKLVASGRLDQIRITHLKYLLSFTAQGKDEQGIQRQTQWFSRLAVEVENLRAALATCLDFKDSLAGLRLVWNLRVNMMFPGRLFGYSDARGWLSQLLTIASQPTLERAHGLIVLGHLVYSQGEYPEALNKLEEALAIAETIGDQPACAEAAFLLAWPAAGLGDHALAHSLLERSRKLYDELNDPVHLAFVVLVQGEMACQEGDLALALQLDEESLALHRRLTNQYMLPTALGNLAKVLVHFGKYDRAWELIRESWSIEPSAQRTIDIVIMIAAFLNTAQRQPDRATRLFGFHETLLASFGYHIDIGDRPDYERYMAELRLQLGERAFDAALKEGRALTLEQAIELALGEEINR